MGRPSLYTDEILEEVCARLSKGEPLAQICRDEHMPAARTVRLWVAGNAQVATAIAGAREDGFDQIALDALDIADETAFDAKDGPDGRLGPNSEWIARSKLRVETRLKLLAKWDPKRYGERQLIGSDPENPLPSGFSIRLVRNEDRPMLEDHSGDDE
jgi:hypothetical protein